VTREYYVGNGAGIVYMSNYYAGNWDVGGNRFTLLAGETYASLSIGGGPSNSIVHVLDAQSNILSTTLTCDGTASLSIPAGAKFVRVFVGVDPVMDLLYDAPACGVDAPPLHGFITAQIS
jgi:hypothetical protein